jgi:hypothetical protein
LLCALRITRVWEGFVKIELLSRKIVVEGDTPALIQLPTIEMFEYSSPIGCGEAIKM